jgi:hypothetical protein
MIRLRPRKELILRVLRRGWRGWLWRFLAQGSGDWRAKLAAGACEDRLAVHGETGASNGSKNVKGRNFL